MKSILETSMYLILMTLICVLSINYIIANRQVNSVNNTACFIKDFVEINGKWEYDEQSSYCLSKETLERIKEYMGENMQFEYTYAATTEGYIYFNACLYYEMSIPCFNISKKHPYKMLIRAVN